MQKYLIFVLTACALYGCSTNPYTKFYYANPQMDSQVVEKDRAGPAPALPLLMHGTFLEKDVDDLGADGWVIIGASSFNHVKSDDAMALKQGQLVQAERILVYRHFSKASFTYQEESTHSLQGVGDDSSAPRPVKNKRTAASIQFNPKPADSPIGFIPIQFGRYDSLAIFLVKQKSAFGANFRNLSDEEARRIGTVNGLAVVAVIRGSPAAAAGVLPGDLLLKVGLVPIVSGEQFDALIRERAGQVLDLSLLRNGAVLNRSTSVLP